MNAVTTSQQQTQAGNGRLDKTPSTRKAAHFYAALGWAIFPVWPMRGGECACGKPNCGQPANEKTAKGKHPITPQGFKNATTDMRIIDAWWDKYPDANIGMATGAASGVYVIDVDPDKGGDVSWDMLTAENDPLPDTVESETGGGGNHIFFKHVAGLGCTSGRLGRGIDTRGDGGYVILPPSNHRSGNRYEWELSSHPGHVEPADMPDWLLALLTEEKHAATAVSFSANGSSGAPDLARWRLSEIHRAAILHGPQAGADRSAIDQSVITALVRAGATDDDILAVFEHYPIGEKFREKGAHDRQYLAHSIGNARGFLNSNGNGPQTPGGAPAAADGFTDYQAALTAVAQLAATPDGETEAQRTARERELLNMAARCAGLSMADWMIVRDAIGAALSGKKTALDRIWREARHAASAPQAGDMLPSVEIVQLLQGMGYTFALDDMTGSVLVNGEPLNDVTRARMVTYVQDRRGHGEQRIVNAVVDYAAQNPQHAIRDYFTALPPWDGEDHVATVIGALRLQDDTQRHFARCWLLNAIDKAHTGAQNFCLVIDGFQGIGKSTLIRGICPDVRWFIEGNFNPDNKDDQIRLLKTFIWELGELQSIVRRADREALKRTLTMRDVTVRLPYGRFDITRPVMTSFLGTINNTGTGFLSDPTGNRRFAVVRSTVQEGKQFDDAWLRVDTRQFWAQLWQEYQAGARGEITAAMRFYQNAMHEFYQQGAPVIDLFSEFFVYDLTVKAPLTHEDLNGGVWNATEIIVMLQTYCGLRDSQKQNRTILAEHLLKLTGRAAANCRSSRGGQKWGWSSIWMTKTLGDMVTDARHKGK